MELKERLAYCSECSKRKMDMNTGLLCSLTGAKPEFEDRCPNFDGDISKVDLEKGSETSISKSTEIGGLLWWYLYVFAGLGAVTTIVANLVTFDYSDYGCWSLATLDIIMWLFYSALGIYVIVAFNKRLPNAVALARTHLIMLVLMNSLALLGGDFETTGFHTESRVISSLIWAVICFIYISSSQRVKDLIPKSTRHFLKWDKIALAVWIFLILFLFVFGIFQSSGVNPFASGDKKVEQEIAVARQQLPMEMNEYLDWTDIEIVDGDIIYTYTFKSDVSAADFDYSYKQELGLMDNERLIYSFYIDEDPDEYLENGYGQKRRYLDKSGEYIYQTSISAEDYSKAKSSTSGYRTEPAALQNLVALFNTRLPEDYIGGTSLDHVQYDENYSRIIFNMTIPGVNSNSLEALTDSYLRNYMDENLGVINDDMMELAYMNGLDVVFRFNVDFTSLWSSTVTYSADQYRQKVSF